MTARVLVIEDNSENMELMLFLLKSFGIQPLIAFDGSAGVELALSTLPDLILCDIGLPGKSGLNVIKSLRAISALAHIPVIAVTGMTMGGDEERILRLGFDGYLAKPFSPDGLRALLDQFLPRAPTPV